MADPDDTTPIYDRGHLSQIEDDLMQLDGATELLCHLAASPNQVTSDAIYAVERMVSEAAQRLRAAFEGEFKARRDMEDAHAAALAAVKPVERAEMARLGAMRSVMERVAQEVLTIIQEPKDGAGFVQ